MATKPIRITSHARFEMKRRGIRVSELAAVVRNPDQVLASVKGRHIYQSKIGRLGRLLLRVVVREGAKDYLVVTAYKTSKVAKYWRVP